MIIHRVWSAIADGLTWPSITETTFKSSRNVDLFLRCGWSVEASYLFLLTDVPWQHCPQNHICANEAGSVSISWAVCFRSDMKLCSIFLYSLNDITVQIFALLLFRRAKPQECAWHLRHSNLYRTELVSYLTFYSLCIEILWQQWITKMLSWTYF